MRSETASNPMTVGALTNLIKNNLETSFASICVEGELTGTKLATSGHLYFALKDATALIQGVMFRFKAQTLDFLPSDGLKVVVRGSLSVYGPRGQYQLLATSMRTSGLGDLLEIIEERKRRLAAEGLFDQERKRSLPRRPARIGIVTSPSGAALHDILSILKRRNAGIDILIYPAAVQGAEAPRAIAARIRQANRHGLADVLIVGRGGGSPEDLLAFSDEEVVRAIAESRIPVVSAVGHEIDWSLADLSADVRAATPSAAAELVAEQSHYLGREIEQLREAMAAYMRERIEAVQEKLDIFNLEDLDSRWSYIFHPYVQRIDEATLALSRPMEKMLIEMRHRLERSLIRLEMGNPRALLSKGYAIVRKIGPSEGAAAGAIVKSAALLEPGELLQVEFESGKAITRVQEVEV